MSYNCNKKKFRRLRVRRHPCRSPTPCDDADILETAAVLLVNHHRIKKGDMVLVSEAAGLPNWDCPVSWRGFGCAEVWFHSRINDHTLTCISQWPLAEESDDHIIVRTADWPIIIPSVRLITPLVHMRTQSHSALGLLPLPYRS